MGQILRNRYIFAALGFSVLLIAGAYVLAQGLVTPPVAQASTETALLEQVANKDSTGDGLPDWQKVLYGIPLDATTTDYFHLGMDDGAAVAKGLIVPVANTNALNAPTTPTSSATVGGVPAPTQGSLTDTFSKNFFALYLSAEQANGGSLTADQINAIADQALGQLESSVAPAPDFKTAVDIKVSGSGPEALKAYAANAEAIISTYDQPLPENQLQYLQDYLTNSDPSALANLAKISTFYQDVATGLAAIPVPQELATKHLALVNSLARVGWEIGDFSRVNTDPLAAMIALDQHPQTVIDMAREFNDIEQQFASEGVTLPAGSPGAQFVTAGSAVSTPTP